MTDRLTPGQLRDLAHLHRVWKSIPEGAMSWDEFLDTRANADGERKEAARREAEGHIAVHAANLKSLADSPEDMSGVIPDAPPPPAPFVTDHKWLDPECHASGCQTLILKGELEKLKDQRDKYMWQVRDTCARAEAAEAREKRLREALEPFAKFGEKNTDNDGWNDDGLPASRERILDHFGPSDFRNARAALAQGGTDGR